jgi:hypothetical protein
MSLILIANKDNQNNEKLCMIGRIRSMQELWNHSISPITWQRSINKQEKYFLRSPPQSLSKQQSILPKFATWEQRPQI